jgi:hypothetical protein
MPYIRPEDVRSPKAHWQLIDVLLDRGEEDGAYALGEWDGERRIGFRWNGTEENPIGNPQSRGLPTYTMLDPGLHEAVIALLPQEKRLLARRFLGTGLLFDGVTLTDDRSSLILWDVRQSPPILAKIACSTIRDLVGQPTISEDECRVLVDRNREVVTEVAQQLFANNRYTQRENGMRIIEIALADLQSVASQFSSTVLDVARLSNWIR